jgi:hypothetical protein
MKVKQLRSWLLDIGEKHNQHYKRGHENHHLQQKKKQNSVIVDGDDMLVIQSKPSNASTSPTSSTGSISSQEINIDALKLSNIFDDENEITSPSSSRNSDSDTILANKISLHDGEGYESYYPDPSFLCWSEESSLAEDFAHNKPYDELDTKKCDRKSEYKTRRVTFGGIQGIDSMRNDLPAAIHQWASVSITTSTITPENPEDARDAVSKDDSADLRLAPQAVLRERLGPKDLPFLLSEETTPAKSDIQALQEKPESTVNLVIEKFGGQGTRKTMVEKRKDELQQLWNENKAVKHVKKTKWCVCQKTGVYKKKIVVDVEYK